MNDYEKYLAQVIPEKDCLKTVKAEAKRFYKTHSPAECLDTGMSLYQSENFQIQETGVLLLGYCDFLSHLRPSRQYSVPPTFFGLQSISKFFAGISFAAC